MRLKESFTTATTFSKILALVLFITLPFLGFYLGIIYKQNTIKKDCPTCPVIESKKVEFSNVFTSQNYGYTIVTPSQWKGEVEQANSFEGVTAYSPNYRQASSIRGFDKGAEIFFRAEKATGNNIKEELKKDYLWNEIAFNVKNINYKGVEAVQYDYKYEGTQAVDTVFIKNGNKYVLRLNYAESRNEFWKEYLSVLDSLEFKK